MSANTGSSAVSDEVDLTKFDRIAASGSSTGRRAADDGIDLTKFDAIAEKSLSDGTRKIYRNKLKRIREVLLVPDDPDDPEDPDTSDSEEEANEEAVKGPQEIEDINPRKLLKFIEEESEHASGESKTASTPEAYRNALMFYYRKHNIKPIPVEIEVHLAKFIKGVRNMYAAGRRDGTHKATEGKDVLDFSTYEQICLASMTDGNFNGHLYMILMWNMASRSDNAQALNYQSLSWTGDCITVTIEKSKARQAGAMRGASHEFKVYGNPKQPAMCILLALGIET